jgi:hypothetical protein
MKNLFKTEESLRRAIQNFTIGKWGVASLPHEVVVSEKEILQMKYFAKKWSLNFNQNHQNWTKRAFGIPSSFIRFDYTLDVFGDVQVFEIEDRPAGIEINANNNLKMFDLFIQSLKDLVSFSGLNLGLCVSPGRIFNSDDFFWIQRISNEINCRVVIGEIPREPEDSIWLVRSLRGEKDYHFLSKYSFSTVEYEGDKSYGVAMGLWEELNGNILWDKPFVLKPDAGCRCENVYMYHPKKPGGGYATRSKIEKVIRDNSVKYIQKYHSPEFPDFLPDGYAMIRRCFLVFDVNSLSYQVIGGQWEARPKCHKVHGASDSICGPLVC